MTSNTPPQFVIPVDGIGTFKFAKKTVRTDIAVNVEYAFLTSGAPVDPSTELVCRHLAAIKVQTIEAPESWGNPEEFDPYDPDTYDKILKVGEALREKELSFRPARKAVAEGGEGEGV